MSRTADADQVELFSKAYNALSLSTQTRLLNDLNVEGHNDGKAILPYYMPAIFFKALENVACEPVPQKIEAVSSLMRFLARFLDGTRSMPGKKGKVVKRNVLFARAIVRCEEFKQDSTTLDKAQATRRMVSLRELQWHRF